ncbi:MAG: AAA family ATPase [Dehalococcoidia bacterium]|nr:AAA family ATPase [Dehalococcoidia bacterium]
MRRFLLQMAGESGTGKSTLAKAIGRATGAVVLDKDIIKSRILDGEEVWMTGLPEEVAGPLHHAIVFDLVDSLLQQGFSVVIDGAAFFPSIRARGQALAEAAGAAYYIIECSLPDLVTLQSRIDSKELMTSQPRVASLSGFARPGTGPITEPHLIIDTRKPPEVCLPDALEYLSL